LSNHHDGAPEQGGPESSAPAPIRNCEIPLAKAQLAILLLIALIFYVSAVMAVNLCGQEFPELFGTLGAPLFKLFTIMIAALRQELGGGSGAKKRRT
jgi:hypothetical protein